MGEGKQTHTCTYSKIEYNSPHTEAEVVSEVHWVNTSKDNFPESSKKSSEHQGNWIASRNNNKFCLSEGAIKRRNI